MPKTLVPKKCVIAIILQKLQNRNWNKILFYLAHLGYLCFIPIILDTFKLKNQYQGKNQGKEDEMQYEN